MRDSKWQWDGYEIRSSNKKTVYNDPYTWQYIPDSDPMKKTLKRPKLKRLEFLCSVTAVNVEQSICRLKIKLDYLQ
jgi:hypothetical protein